MRTFTKLRELLLSNKDILLALEKLDKKMIYLGYDVKMHDNEIDTSFNLIDERRKERDVEISKQLEPRAVIGFETAAVKRSKSNKALMTSCTFIIIIDALFA